MKKLFFLLIIVFINCKVYSQFLFPKVEKSDVPECQIMQIGITDSSTNVFFKYTNPLKYKDGGWICAGENFYIKDNQTGKKYKMISSLNIPICPSKHYLDYANQVHYFSLSFQPIPKGTKEIDIIENPEKGFNFYGVSLINPEMVKDNTDYIGLLESTPVKEYGSFIKDGQTVLYYIHNGIEIALNLSLTNNYGKYYTASISIRNYSGKRFDFLPDSITATSISNNIKTPAIVLSYNDYMKKVNKVQEWSSFFEALGEIGAASNAGYSHSTSSSNTSDYINSDGNTFGYFGNTYGSVNYNIRTYGNSSTNATTYNYDGAANYYAQQNANTNIANFNNQQYLIKESINQGYLKANTIFPHQQVNGYINIKFVKADIIYVTIKINGESYIFSYRGSPK